MKERTTTLTRILLVLPLMLISVVAHGLDFPHEPSNPIIPDLNCLSCHDLNGGQIKLLKPSTPHPEMGVDDTNPNNLCWSCHTGPQLAPYRVPHSSQQTGNQFGEWNIECRTCHWPHSQPQVRAFREQAYLASGTVDNVTSGAMISTLTDNEAGWETDEHAGRVVFPDINATNEVGWPASDLSYRVLSNTANSLTIDGAINLDQISPGDKYVVVYGKLIQSTLEVPGTNEWKTVKFFNNSGPNSYADSDSTLDGVCQVCHTKTGHFRNDGQGEDQMHRNADPGDPNGTAGETCTAKCHKHIGGFGHGKGYTKVDLCVECHGHEKGTYYMVDGRYPYNPADEARLSKVPSRGFGSTAAHSTHTESWINAGTGWGKTTPESAGEDDRRGPGIYCNVCHDIDNMPSFKSGADRNEDGLFTLDETDVCDSCHSPEGSYNGVDTVGDSVGAKNNWRSNGVYSADNITLKPGKEKWCAGCHDERHEAYPSVPGQPDNPAELFSSHIDTTTWDTEVGINRFMNVVAPPVIGDEDGVYNYGTGWGFFKTGHGLPSDETIPASGGSKAGPGRQCNQCHDPRMPHIDGNQRTFKADNLGPTDSDDYQTSYRLKYAMTVPIKYNPLTGPRESDYQLCFSCHDFEKIVDAENKGLGPQTSNFFFDKDGDPPPPAHLDRENLHYLHLNFGAELASADWSGEYNSRPTCIYCHNPHGTTNPTMMRTGKILEVDPDAGEKQKLGLRLWYWNDEIAPDMDIPLWTNLIPPSTAQPNPANLTLSASKGFLFLGYVGNDGVFGYGYCAGDCHAAAVRQLGRTPIQETDQTPFLDWIGQPEFESDGVGPDIAEPDANITFRVEYKDWDGDAPISVDLWVDVDNDDLFEEATERFSMAEASGQVMPYSHGRDYTKTLTLSKIGDGLVKYYFAATDEDGAATGPATNINTLRLVMAAPQLSWTNEQWYKSDGVNPNIGGDGSQFVFRVTYSNSNSEAPSSILLLEDLNSDGVADASYPMSEVAGGNYLTGMIYSYEKSVGYAATAAGSAQYAFSAIDSVNSAIGEPTQWSSFSVLPSSNNPALLQWVTDSADCRIDSAKPNTTLQTGSAEFKIHYFDSDNAAPISVTLELDLNGNGNYDGGAESIAMSWVSTGSDSNWANGEFYEAIGITPAISGALKYRFQAIDSSGGAALGDPVTTDKLFTVYANDGATKGVLKGLGAVDPWYNTIQSAIDAVDGAHTVLVMEGSYTEDLYLSYANDENTTLKSLCGADSTILQATSTEANAIGLYFLTGTSTIDGFQITGGTRGIEDGTSAALIVKNSKIHGNNNSGIYKTSAPFQLLDSELYNNTSTFNGGGLYLSHGADHTITNTVFRDNLAVNSGGGIYMTSSTGTLTFTDLTVNDNSASNDGGGLYLSGIYNNRPTISCDKCTIMGNQAGTTSGNEGGGIYVVDPLTLNNSVVSDNTAYKGGGIYNSTSFVAGGPTTVNNSTLANNSATLSGGAFHTAGAAATINNSIIWGNVASGGSFTGHAIHASSSAPATITNTIIQNDGDPIFNNHPHVYNESYVTITGFISDSDPYFADSANRDYHIQNISPAIGNAGADALTDDRDSNTRSAPDIGAYEYISTSSIPAPVLAWTGEEGFTTNGVSPDQATGGTNFEFRVDYTHATGTPPAPMEVWIDANDNGAFEEFEKHAMTQLTGGTGSFNDGDFSNGERYSYTAQLYHAGDSLVNYRFFSAVEGNLARGASAAIQQVKVDNGIPQLSWVGNTNFETDGVHPNKGAAGGDFIFRVKYQDIDDTAPKVAQIWVDANDDHIYSEAEKHNLTKEGMGIDYRNGETYTSAPVILHSAGDERLRYRFYFTDNKSEAKGEPTNVDKAKERYSRYVIASTVATLNWTGESYYLTDGVYPNTAMGSANFEFRVSYTDPSNRPPSPIQLWVDSNDNGTYEAHEKHAMAESDQSDDNYSDGKIYSKVLFLTAMGDENINYRFFASNNFSEAIGAATANSSLNINFTQSVSGTVYSDNGITPIADGSIIRLVHNGKIMGSGYTANGVYTIPAVYYPGDSLIACIEGNIFNGTSRVVAIHENITDLDVYGGFNAISWECVKYVSFKPIDNTTHITTARAVAAPNTDNAIEVSMGYTGDTDANNSYTISYCLQNACGSWINHVVDVPRAPSPYVTTITGLTPGETYKVQLLYSDDQVDGVNPVEVTDITLLYNATTPGVAAASARSFNSLYIEMPYSNDANGSNSYTLEYKPSSSSIWSRWVPDPQPHMASPFSTAITGLNAGGIYDVQLTYNDADGFINGEPTTQTFSSIELVNNGTLALTATATIGQNGIINISMPYLHDLNADNNYSIEYKLSDTEQWTTWGADIHPHAPSPFEVTLPELEKGKHYDIRVTYFDNDGFIGGSSQQIIPIYLPYGDQVVCQSNCNNIGDYHSTIQAAVDAAAAGDIITVLPGTYPENLLLGSSQADVTLKSRDGADSVTITGTDADEPVVKALGGNHSVLQGLTLNNANEDPANTKTRGLYVYYASPVIQESIIEDNHVNLDSYSPGGGIHVMAGDLHIERSWIRGNTGSSGAGINCTNGDINLVNSIVSGNGSFQNGYGRGGGLYVFDNCSATVISSTFSGNRADSWPGILGQGSVTVKYSIFWGNQNDSVVEEPIYPGYDVSYSVVQYGYSGVGNLAYNPRFIMPIPWSNTPTSAGNYRLKGYTFTHDSILDLELLGGDTMDPLTPADDYDGNPRPSGAGYTMGAFE